MTRENIEICLWLLVTAVLLSPFGIVAWAVLSDPWPL